MQELKAEGIRLVMVTGDHRDTAEAVARQLGIEEVMADVCLDQKGQIIARLKSQGRVVAMAGDGVNDAPALALADVGIAMGTGADTAIESAGITLVKGGSTRAAPCAEVESSHDAEYSAKSLVCLSL